MTGKTVVGRAHVYGCCLVTEPVNRRNWRLVRIERLHSIGPRSATTSGHQGADNQQCYSDVRDDFLLGVDHLNHIAIPSPVMLGTSPFPRQAQSNDDQSGSDIV